MCRRTYISADHRLSLSMGNYQHLCHKLLQDIGSQCNTRSKRNRISNHDVLYGFANEAGNLFGRNHSPNVHAHHVPSFALIVDFRLIVHDLNVGVRFLLRNLIWSSGGVCFHGSYH